MGSPSAPSARSCSTSSSRAHQTRTTSRSLGIAQKRNRRFELKGRIDHGAKGPRRSTRPPEMLSQRIEGGKDGKDADDQLTDWEAASVERICANADLVPVKPAVAIAVRDSGVRAERGFVRVQ